LVIANRIRPSRDTRVRPLPQLGPDHNQSLVEVRPERDDANGLALGGAAKWTMRFRACASSSNALLADAPNVTAAASARYSMLGLAEAPE
jgi:hypothetical protein